MYTPVWGEVSFDCINNIGTYIIGIVIKNGYISLTKDGRYIYADDAECILFPSKDQRDWSKFTAPWYKKENFDPNTFRPYDKILVRDSRTCAWRCTFYSHTKEDGSKWKYITGNSAYECCIPYNDETKHLVGTTDEAPDFYRYWEE